MPFSAPSYLELAMRRLKGKRLKKGLAPRAPVALERDYQRDLLPYLQTIHREIQLKLIPQLPLLAAEFDAYRNKKRDAAPDDVDRLMRSINLAVDQQWTRAEIARIATKKGLEVSRYNAQVIKNNIKKVVGVDVIFADPQLANEMALFTVNNTTLIESISDESIRKVESMVYQGLADGTRVEELSQNILAYTDPEEGVTRSRANLIARDQVSKLNGQLTQMRQTDLGVSRYVWRTVGDERVRESHRAKDGKIFRWDEPPADTGHPGEDYQCRCYAEPVLSDLVPGTAEDDE